MRLRCRTWLVISVLSFLGAAIFWRLGEQRVANARAGRPAETAPASNSTPGTPGAAVKPGAALKLLAPGARLAGTVPAALRESVAAALPEAPTNASAAVVHPATGPKPGLRLRNTTRTDEELLHDDAALVLRNAVIDTRSGVELPIPGHLRAGAEPGSYIVQARGAIDTAFRNAIRAAGAEVVSYLPQNAYLVSASAAQAAAIRGAGDVRAVLPFEPYFKLEPSLLRKAIGDEPVPSGTRLNLSLLPGTRENGRAVLESMGATLDAEFETPFGPALTVTLAGGSLASLARLPEVQGIEPHRQRQLLNDLTRERFGISTGTNAPGSYTNALGLTGTNVWINVNDSGIDSTHGDLAGRVTADQPSTLVDFVGHGTHVAGTIAGNGAQSGTVTTTPPGSAPAADLRGMAPAARLFALPIDLITGPLISDTYLQQTAATNYYVVQGRTNVLLSNNSWGYTQDYDYSLASASYDAAVRDALPAMTGAQPIVYVFAAGNEGFGAEDGQGGEPSTIRAPGTAKNVITVGAIESPRGITNEVVYTDAQGELQTNQVFLAETDTHFQITSFSGRGNVEPGVEGRFGRFKPDVVAPGAFTLSTRSKDWLDPRGFSDTLVGRLDNQEVVSGGRNNYSMFVPAGAAEFRVRALPNLRSPDPMPGLPMYLRFAGTPDPATDLVSTNNAIRVPPDGTMQPGDWRYAVGNFTFGTVAYDLLSVITLTNDFGDYFVQLKKLNDAVGPQYRYESGSSMAAPAVTGLLALFQDYFQKENRGATPALLKALLVNGARSLGALYNFSVSDVINLQGWGAVSLTNTLPAYNLAAPTGVVHAVQYLDATGADALVTGQSRSWKLAVSPAAQDQILKLTLVWTDPPGNPSAGLKLVNDLDLQVRNEDDPLNPVHFAGNDIPYRSDFTTPRLDAESVTNDVVNNVENILIRPPLGTNYVVTIRGRRVNVNAVTGHPDGIAQDFAFVASLEDKSLTNAMTFTAEAPVGVVQTPSVAYPTNGLALLNQRVGANAPRLGLLPGATNQWQFFVFTNSQRYTPPNLGLTNGPYVAFITFLPPNLGHPRNRDADIDLYVSRDASLTNLNPAAIQAADKARKPGGTELVFYTNAIVDTVYYVGVKSEDQQASEFGFAALSSNTPFDEDDQFGNRIVRGLPYNLPIPDGSPDTPQAAYIFGIATRSFPVQRVVVTNTLSFDSTGDILGNLSHNDAFVVLNNHALDPNLLGNVSTLIYDDSNGGDISSGGLFARPTDGPGRLTDFIGSDSTGVWILSAVDNAVTQNATNVSLSLMLQPQFVADDFYYTTVEGNGANFYYVDVPANATNLTVRIAGLNQPLWVAVRRGAPPTPTEYDKAADISPPEGELRIGLRDVPPLNAGRWYIGVYNFNPTPVDYGILVDVDIDLARSSDRPFTSDLTPPILDDARVVSSIRVTEDLDLVDLKVGIRVDHPRVSDLTFHVVSPQGTRLLLSENRGGPDGTGYGIQTAVQKIFTAFTDNTNLTTLPIKLGVAPFTNNPVLSNAGNRVVFADSFEGVTPEYYFTGAIFEPGWEVLAGAARVARAAPGITNVADGDQYVVLTGDAEPEIRVRVPVVPNRQYRLRFAVSRLPGGTQGLVASVGPSVASLEVTEAGLGAGWSRIALPFSSAVPLVDVTFRAPRGRLALALDDIVVEEVEVPLNAHYHPEEPLKPLLGERAVGEWKLEVTDTRAGPAGGIDPKFEWRLELVFALPAVDAIQLTNNVPYYGTATGEDIRYFYIDVPRCATIATNTIAGDLGTLLLFADRDGLPTASLEDFTDDFGPFLNVEGPGIANFVLSTSSRPLPLMPGQRFYLAVRNFQTDLTNNAFGIRVAFDCTDPVLPVVPSLTNGVPIRAILPPGPALHYYQLNVSSNAIYADFSLRPVNGNVDLFIRRGRADDFPLPSPNRWDYKSDSPNPGVTDYVEVGLTTPPMPLEPGIWYVAVRNTTSVAVEYELLATETYATLIQLQSGVAVTNSIASVDPQIGLTPRDLQYYAFLVSSNSVRARFEVPVTDGDVNLFLHRGVPLASPVSFDYAGLQSGPVPESISVTNTTMPVPLAPGWWFLTIENADATNVTYAVMATEFGTSVTPLVSGVAVTNNVAFPGPDPTYFSFDVSPGAISARFEVFDMSSDVQLVLKPGLPLPTMLDHAYASTNAGVVPEDILLSPLSFPVGLTPGPWYLGVLNPGPVPATFSVRATEESALIRVLTNGLPQNASIPGGPGSRVDYFQFTVSPGATAAEFRLTSGRTGNLDLYLRKGLPLPDPANAHYRSARAGTFDELIRIDTNSAPIAVSPGIWYLMVTNRTAAVVGYEITATEYGVVPPDPSGQITDLELSTNRTCLTWISIPGTNYFVVAKTNVLDPAWTAVSPTIRATTDRTTWCLEPPGPWRFFDVLEGESTLVPIPAPVPELRFDGENICVGWNSLVGTAYHVEARRAFAETNWTTLTFKIVATTNFTEVCYPVDLGYRFFRVGVGERVSPTATPLPDAVVRVDRGVDQVCVSWPSRVATRYLVEGRRHAAEANWTVLSEPLDGTGGMMSICLDAATEFTVFRVIEGVSLPLQRPPSLPVATAVPSVDASFDLCFTWDAIVGAEYFVEAKQRLADTTWTVISPILTATTPQLAYCQSLRSSWRYFQVRRVNREPAAALEIDAILPVDGKWWLTWSGPVGARYQVFSSESSPTVWRPLGGPVSSLTGTFEFTDPTSPPPSFRLYRIEQLP